MPPLLRDLIELHVVVDPTFDQNCYVLRRRDTEAALIVDPGLQAPAAVALCAAAGWNCERVVLTHGHPDHVNGVPLVRAAFACSAAIHPADRFLLDHVRMLPGIPADAPDVVIDQDLDAAAPMVWQGLTIQLIHTPGHTPGSLCFLIHGDDSADDLIAGDTLFRRGVGRADLPGGSWPALVFSIENHLYTLPPETVVHPGHGAATTIGEESIGNPFVVHPRYR